MTLRLAVLPNDPLLRYLEKGEVKERYFNPGNLFNEIHVITLAPPDNETSADKVAPMFGEARAEIHCVGRPRIGALRRKRDEIINLARELRIDAVRAYNPLYMGWCAVETGARLDAPSVISIHSCYDILPRLRTYGSFRERLFWAVHLLGFAGLGLERRTAIGASRVIAAYEYAARRYRRWRDDVEVIYNRVDLDRFRPDPARRRDRITILNVSRHDPEKNPESILRAMEGLEDMDLVLVGQGRYTDRLRAIAEELGITDRVEFIPRIPHDEIHDIYRQCHIFALEIFVPGVAIPVLEAMAAGLPVVTNRVWNQDRVEALDDLACIVEPTPDGFRSAFADLLRDGEKRERLSGAVARRASDYDGAVMERREADLYRELLGLPVESLDESS